jgi:phosphonate transport system substrate-binding protein
MNVLKISSCMAPNMDPLCHDLAHFLTASLSMPVEAETEISWQERERLLDSGEIGLCWICGLPYVWKADHDPNPIALLAAPVMRAKRYQNCPVYYSDVVVRADRPFQSLEDLRGAGWAYNEPGSHSGYNVVRAALAARGEKNGFFGRVVGSGSHQASLQMILEGEVDGSAIDSTVLELEIRQRPSLQKQIRIIDTFGPSPIPPWVVSNSVSLALRTKLLQALLGIHQNAQGEEILARIGIARFVAVQDKDYDPIREMDRLAAGLRLGP